MNTIKYYSLTFMFLMLANFLYSENNLELNTFNFFEEDAVNLPPKKERGTCSKEDAEAIIRALPEVTEAQSHIQSLTNNKKGVTIMSDATEVRGESFYTFQVGYDGADRFETYYFLFINKNNCADIRIADAMTGELKSIHEWRKLVQ